MLLEFIKAPMDQASRLKCKQVINEMIKKSTISHNAVLKLTSLLPKQNSGMEKQSRFSSSITFQILSHRREKEREQKLITWESSCRSDLSAEGEGKEAFDAIDFGESANENLNPNPQWGFGSGSNSYREKPKSDELKQKPRWVIGPKP